jgi:hypothetical protein
MNAAKVWNIIWVAGTLVWAVGGVLSDDGIMVSLPHNWLHVLTMVFGIAAMIHNHKNLGDLINILNQPPTPAPPAHLPGDTGSKGS